MRDLTTTGQWAEELGMLLIFAGVLLLAGLICGAVWWLT